MIPIPPNPHKELAGGDWTYDPERHLICCPECSWTVQPLLTAREINSQFREHLLDEIWDVVRRCAGCGVDEEESAYGVLTDATVMVAEGQEGYSEVTARLCDDCLRGFIYTMEELGFVNHHHGSTDLLSDRTCPGDTRMDQCPTPSESKTMLIYDGRNE